VSFVCFAAGAENCSPVPEYRRRRRGSSEFTFQHDRVTSAAYRWLARQLAPHGTEPQHRRTMLKRGCPRTKLSEPAVSRSSITMKPWPSRLIDNPH